MTDNADIVMHAQGVGKSFPGVRALDGVELKIRRGRLNALMGENGAGKSTLMKILAGAYQPDQGQIVLDGQPVAFRNPREAQAAGVSIIYQELTLLDNLSVAENLFLAREPVNRIGLIDRKQMHDQAGRLLARMGVQIDPTRRVGELSTALQQVVEIARAVSFDAKVLILDEPTSSLTAQETESLFALINQLKRDGVGLVYITHRFEELAPIADDITVFRDGRFVDERPADQLDQQELVRLMIGRDAKAEEAAATPGDRQELLSVRSLTRRDAAGGGRPLVEDASFSVGAGEIVGLFGLVGAGRTELLEALFGLCPKSTTGEVCLDGLPLAVDSPAAAIDAGLALAPEDRKVAGLVLGMSVAKNVTLASLDRVSTRGLLSPPRERGTAARYIERFRIRLSSPHQQAVDLSGGNQQKVVLGKWLATGPKLLMLDEPTRGIDVGAKQEVYQLLRELAAEGMGLLVVSSEAPELLHLCDRILVMCEGRMTRSFNRSDADEHKLVDAALPTSNREDAA